MASDDSLKIRVQNRLWENNLGPVWLVVSVTLLIFIFSQFLAVLVVQLFIALLHGSSHTLDNSVVAQFFYVLLAEGLVAVSVFYALKRRHTPLKVIGLGRKPVWADVGRALAGFVAFYALLIIFSAVLTFIFPNLNNGNQDVGFNSLHGGLDYALAFCALVFLPPLGEEILVRGYLYSGFRRSLRFWPALLLTSLLFGAAHLGTGDSGVLWSAGLNTFVLSVVLVYLREKSGALYAGMLVHMLNNLIAFGFHFHL